MNESTIHDQKWIYQFFYGIVQPLNQVVILFIFALILVLLSYWPVTDFHSLEKPSVVTSLTPKKIAEWGVLPTMVDIGLYIINFPSVDFVNNKFIFDGVIWFEFDPALLALDTVGRFSFEKGEILQKSEPNTQIIDKKLFARYDVRVQFTSDLEYQLFPFDDHTIYITIVNRTIQPSEMMFRSYPPYFRLSEQIGLSGWDIYGSSVKTGYSESRLDKFAAGTTISYPKAIFSIDFRRAGIRNSLLILLPMFLIYFLSLFALSFDPKKSSAAILTLSAAGVTSLLAYRFVIENMTPHVGYFVLSDQVFILLLCATLAEFVFAIAVIIVGKLTPFIVVLRGALFIMLNIIILILCYRMLFTMQ